MRILFVASAMPTHVMPLLPFAWAAQTNGHEVRVATQPNLTGVVAGAGLPAVAVGAAIDFSARYRTSRDRVGSADPKSLFFEIAESMVEGLVGLARTWRPDMVVWEPTSFAGPVVAAAVGALSLRHLWGPDIVGRGTSGRNQLPAEIEDLLAPYGTRLADLPEWTTVDPCPPSLQLTPTAPWLPVQYVPPVAPGRVPAWALASPDRPRILVTPGTSVTGLVGDSAFLVPVVMRALAGTDADVLLAMLSQHTALLSPDQLAANVRLVTDCPLPALLPGCDVMVHHGGAGSLLTAARYGVPQLILSQMPDLAFNGRLAAATGAAIWLPADEADEHSIRAAIEALRRDPRHRQAALRLRAEALAQPTPVQLLRDLTATPDRGAPS